MTTRFGGIQIILLLLKWPWGPDLRSAVSPAPPFFLSQNQPDFGQKGWGNQETMSLWLKFSDLFPTDFPYSKSQPEYWDSNSHLQSTGTLTHVTRVLVFEPTSPECWDSKPHLQSNFCSPVIVVCSFGRCAPSLECSKSQLACRSC